MQNLIIRSKLFLLVLLSVTLTSSIFGTDYNYFRVNGSFDNYDLRAIAESYFATDLIDMSSIENRTKLIDSVITPAQPVTTIWSRMSDEFTLNHQVQSKRVQKEIHSILADKAKLYQILQTSAPYIYFINQQVQAKKFPAELALLPIIESEFNPHNRSDKGASGLWQLMPQSARDLGLKVRRGSDDRQNVVKSTNAALAYLNDLQHLFKGNWYLAIAAYNSGEINVLHAVRRAGTTNFFDLQHLPQETKIYVPKLLALAAIMKDPQKYGVVLPPVNDAPYFVQGKVTKSINLTNIAKVTGINDKVLRALNPDYHNGESPNKGSLVLFPLADISRVQSQLGDNVELQI